MRTNQAEFSATLSALLMMACLMGVCRSQETRQTQNSSLIDAILFYPSDDSDGDWRPKGLPFEDVRFESADGTKLHGWYCKCEDPQAIVLFAHGNAGNVATRGWLVRELLNKAKVTVFLFDYRGYGRSEGKATIDGALADTRAARTKLGELASIKESEILLIGESLGGAMVVQLAAESAPRGLILQSTFSSLRDIAKVHFPSARTDIVDVKTLDSTTQIGGYSGPLFQSHGNADEIIPFELGQKLFLAANEPKTFYSIPGAGHNNWFTREYLRELNRFVSKLPK